MKSGVTIYQVAAEAGTGASTVSRVLSGDPALRVRPETRERVLETVARLKYRPNVQARGLRTSRAGLIALLISDFYNPARTSTLEGAEAAAAEAGSVLMTSSVRGPHGVSRYLELLGKGRVDGVLIGDHRAGPHLVEPLTEMRVPFLLLSQRIPGVDRWVVLRDADASQMAIDHLVSLGHARIGHLRGPTDADTAQRREAGYRAAMARHGLPVEADWVEGAEYNLASGEAAGRRLLARGAPLSAVLVANFAMAMGFMKATRAFGLRVPNDLSVVTLQDTALAGFLDPELTTVSLPFRELGRQGVELLMSSGPEEKVQVEVEAAPVLNVRESTAAL